jgi:hypothetical protein
MAPGKRAVAGEDRLHVSRKRDFVTAIISIQARPVSDTGNSSQQAQSNSYAQTKNLHLLPPFCQGNPPTSSHQLVGFLTTAAPSPMFQLPRRLH